MLILSNDKSILSFKKEINILSFVLIFFISRNAREENYGYGQVSGNKVQRNSISMMKSYKIRVGRGGKDKIMLNIVLIEP